MSAYIVACMLYQTWRTEAQILNIKYLNEINDRDFEIKLKPIKRILAQTWHHVYPNRRAPRSGGVMFVDLRPSHLENPAEFWPRAQILIGTYG